MVLLLLLRHGYLSSADVSFAGESGVRTQKRLISEGLGRVLVLLSNLRRADVAMVSLDLPVGRPDLFTKHGAGTRQQLNLLFTRFVLPVEEYYLDGLI